MSEGHHTDYRLRDNRRTTHFGIEEQHTNYRLCDNRRNTNWGTEEGL